MIEGFCGGLGSGKSLRLTARIKDYFNSGLKVYSNYNLFFKHEKVNPLDLLDFELEKCVVGLTEAYTFMDSRFSGSEASRFQSYFFLQTRKRKVHVLYDAQLLGSVDIRLRGITNRVYECHKLIKDRNKDAEDIDNIIGFGYKVQDDDGTVYYESLSIDEAKKIFPLYDTTQILLPQYINPVTIEDLDGIITTFNESSNKETFISLIRANNPYLAYEKCRAIYTLLKNDKLEDVKKILRIKNIKNE